MAALSKLDFSGAELEAFAREFDGILKFVSAINDAEVPSGSEKFLPSVDFADLREDVVRPSLTPAEVLLNAPESDGEYFVTPQVVE